MIIRTKKGKNPFVQIDSRMLGDKRLSWKAKGILAYLLSKPDDWWARSEDIINHSTDRRDAVQNAMRELRDCGYAKLVNTPGGRQWFVFEQPQEPSTEKPVMATDPSTGNPSMGLAIMAKSATTNKEKRVSNKEESNTDELPLGNTRNTFKPPPVLEVEGYLTELGLNGAARIEAQKFCDHHQARGWFLSKGLKMADWKCACRTWQRNWQRFNPQPAGKTDEEKARKEARKARIAADQAEQERKCREYADRVNAEFEGRTQ